MPLERRCGGKDEPEAPKVPREAWTVVEIGNKRLMEKIPEGRNVGDNTDAEQGSYRKTIPPSGVNHGYSRTGACLAKANFGREGKVVPGEKNGVASTR